MVYYFILFDSFDKVHIVMHTIGGAISVHVKNIYMYTTDFFEQTIPKCLISNDQLRS